MFSGSVTGLYRQPDSIGAGPYAQRCEHRSAMHFYGPLAQAQFKGNLLVELARRHLQQDFALAAAERCYAIMGSLAPRIVRPRDIFGNLDLRAEIILKLADCVEDR